MGLLQKIVKLLKTKDIVPIKTPVLTGHMLENKTALIVGGTGGIGEAIVSAFLKQGCFVIATGTNPDKLLNLKKEYGDSIECITMNLSEVNDIKKGIDTCEKLAKGNIDILVNCAGVHGPTDFWQIKEKDFDDVMNINVKAAYFTSLFIATYMRENGIKGHILNISSASALKPGKTPYEISKNAVRSMTLGIASECIKYGIIVNCLGPGPVATKMLQKDDSSPLNWEGNPSGRIATREEIANWAVILCSDLGNLVIGDSVYVSGGSGTICIDK